MMENKLLIKKLEENISKLSFDDITLLLYNYLSEHTYFKYKTIAREYLVKNYGISYLRNALHKQIIYQKAVRTLIGKFNRFTNSLMKANVISKYSNKNYKIINGKRMSLEDFREIINN